MRTRTHSVVLNGFSLRAPPWHGGKRQERENEAPLTNNENRGWERGVPHGCCDCPGTLVPGKARAAGSSMPSCTTSPPPTPARPRFWTNQSVKAHGVRGLGRREQEPSEVQGHFLPYAQALLPWPSRPVATTPGASMRSSRSQVAYGQQQSDPVKRSHGADADKALETGRLQEGLSFPPSQKPYPLHPCAWPSSGRSLRVQEPWGQEVRVDRGLKTPGSTSKALPAFQDPTTPADEAGGRVPAGCAAAAIESDQRTGGGVCGAGASTCREVASEGGEGGRRRGEWSERRGE